MPTKTNEVRGPEEQMPPTLRDMALEAASYLEGVEVSQREIQGRPTRAGYIAYALRQTIAASRTVEDGQMIRRWVKGLVDAGITLPPSRQLFSELIHIAAEMVKSNGFLSPYDPMPKRRLLRGIAEKQEEKLKDWAYRIRQVANKISTTPSPALRDDSVVTVQSALAELKELWPNGSFRVSFSSDLPRCTVMILRERHHSVHHPTVDADTLALAMTSIRAWREKETN